VTDYRCCSILELMANMVIYIPYRVLNRDDNTLSVLGAAARAIKASFSTTTSTTTTAADAAAAAAQALAAQADAAELEAMRARDAAREEERQRMQQEKMRIRKQVRAPGIEAFRECSTRCLY